MARDGLDSFRSGSHDAFFIVLEKLQETLRDRLQKWTSQRGIFFTSNDLKRTMLRSKSEAILQIAAAMEYLHEKARVIHRESSIHSIRAVR